MGVEDPGSNRGLFHKANLKHKATVFTIGNRGEVLTSQLESPILVPHSASKNEVRVSISRPRALCICDSGHD